MAVNVVVLGAGVSGLTSALQLCKDPNVSVTVIAKHMPGDYSGEYASPWAGATFQPYSSESESQYESATWPELSRLAANVPEAGIHFQRNHILRRKEEMESSNTTFDSMYSLYPWYSRLFPDFRELRPNELPKGADSGCQYTSVCINTAVYLPWLVGQCRKNGVVFRRATVSHIRELQTMHHSGNTTDIIVNTSGLGAAKLGGVMDTLMSPIRGQIVLVENEVEPMYNISGTNDGSEEVSYLMTRAAGGGTVLGGTYNKGSWDIDTDPATTERIIKRCLSLNPQLGNGKGREGVRVIRSGVGLRPWRRGGVRIESDLDTLKDGTLIVHNYGHAGWGYQGSYGCAERVVHLVGEFLQTKKSKNLQAKL